MNTQSSETKMHESLCIALILALMGGFLDAYTYILKNGVFANAQTGNLVLLSIFVFTGKVGAVPKYLLPIVFFSLGIVLSECIKSTACIKSELNKIRFALVFKAVLLIMIGLTSPVTADLFTTCSVSFLAAIQVGIFNKLKGSAVATTMITGNLKSAMQSLHLFVHKNDHAAGKMCVRYLSVIVFFGAGASAGAFLTRVFRDNSIYFCLIFLFAAYAILTIDEKRARR